MMEDQAAGHAVPCVFTIGHSIRGFDEVLEMLCLNKVTELVDVRSSGAPKVSAVDPDRDRGSAARGYRVPLDPGTGRPQIHGGRRG